MFHITWNGKGNWKICQVRPAFSRGNIIQAIICFFLIVSFSELQKMITVLFTSNTCRKLVLNVKWKNIYIQMKKSSRSVASVRHVWMRWKNARVFGSPREDCVECILHGRHIGPTTILSPPPLPVSAPSWSLLRWSRARRHFEAHSSTERTPPLCSSLPSSPEHLQRRRQKTWWDKVTQLL